MQQKAAGLCFNCLVPSVVVSGRSVSGVDDLTKQWEADLPCPAGVVDVEMTRWVGNWRGVLEPPDSLQAALQACDDWTGHFYSYMSEEPDDFQSTWMTSYRQPLHADWLLTWDSPKFAFVVMTGSHHENDNDDWQSAEKVCPAPLPRASMTHTALIPSFFAKAQNSSEEIP